MSNIEVQPQVKPARIDAAMERLARDPTPTQRELARDAPPSPRYGRRIVVSGLIASAIAVAAPKAVDIALNSSLRDSVQANTAQNFNEDAQKDAQILEYRKQHELPASSGFSEGLVIHQTLGR